MKRFATVILCFVSVNGGLATYAHATACTDLAERSASMARDVASIEESRDHREHDDDERVTLGADSRETPRRHSSDGHRRSE